MFKSITKLFNKSVDKDFFEYKGACDFHDYDDIEEVLRGSCFVSNVIYKRIRKVYHPRNCRYYLQYTISGNRELVKRAYTDFNECIKRKSKD